jgi:hypothetical protein
MQFYWIWRCWACLHRGGQEVRAHPILRRSNSNTDWAYLCIIDRQCPLNNWTACAMLMIGCLSGAGIAHRLPETAVVIKTLILLHML